jgi:hypothetical protein
MNLLRPGLIPLLDCGRPARPGWCCAAALWGPGRVWRGPVVLSVQVPLTSYEVLIRLFEPNYWDSRPQASPLAPRGQASQHTGLCVHKVHLTQLQAPNAGSRTICIVALLVPTSAQTAALSRRGAGGSARSSFPLFQSATVCKLNHQLAGQTAGPP